MKLFAAAFVGTVVLGAVTVWADMTVVQKIESTLSSDKPAPTTMTMLIKGSKAKIDFKPELRSMLIDLKAGKLSMIDHGSKQVIIMSIDQMKLAMEMAAKNTAVMGGKMSCQKTGNTKTINGFNCREYKVTSAEPGANATSCWMDEGVDAKEMEPFRVFAMDIAKIIGQDAMAEMKGMMIASEMTMKVQGKESLNRMEVQSISREAIADSAFAVPAGYQSMEMPAMPLLPASPSATPK